jgi:hypothetical protein
MRECLWRKADEASKESLVLASPLLGGKREQRALSSAAPEAAMIHSNARLQGLHTL